MNRRKALVSLFGFVSGLAVAQKPSLLRGLKAITYKSPTCGCCGGYVEFLKNQGVQVEVRLFNEPELDTLKDKLAVPKQVRSCHITQIAGYLVEGHVPLAALEKLLSSRPRLVGIALPGMPVGVPGMPGKNTKPHQVVGFSGKSVTPFMTI